MHGCRNVVEEERRNYDDTRGGKFQKTSRRLGRFVVIIEKNKIFLISVQFKGSFRKYITRVTVKHTKLTCRL